METKLLNLNAYGVEEMSVAEMHETDGGWTCLGPPPLPCPPSGGGGGYIGGVYGCRFPIYPPGGTFPPIVACDHNC